MLIKAKEFTYPRGRMVAVIASSTSKYEMSGLLAPPAFKTNMISTKASINM